MYLQYDLRCIRRESHINKNQPFSDYASQNSPGVTAMSLNEPAPTQILSIWSMNL